MINGFLSYLLYHFQLISFVFSLYVGSLFYNSDTIVLALDEASLKHVSTVGVPSSCWMEFNLFLLRKYIMLKVRLFCFCEYYVWLSVVHRWTFILWTSLMSFSLFHFLNFFWLSVVHQWASIYFILRILYVFHIIYVFLSFWVISVWLSCLTFYLSLMDVYSFYFVNTMRI